MLIKLHGAKCLLWFLVLSGLWGCASEPVVTNDTQPAWYTKRQSPAVNTVVGYGQGSTTSEAKAAALRDISESIQAHVRSQFQCHRLLENGKASEHCEEKVETTSSRLLSGAVVEREEKAGGLHYLKLVYDLSSPSRKIARQLSSAQFSCDNNRQDSNSSLLLSAPLFEDVLQNVECLPKTELYRRDSLWVLQSDHFNVPIVDVDLHLLWPQMQSSSLSMNIPKTMVDGEYFFIDMLLKKKGYLSLFMVDENGQVQSLIPEEKISGRQQIKFPNPEEYDGLISEVKDGKRYTKDYYVAALCDRPVSGAYAPEVTDEHYSKEDANYLFGRYIEAFGQCEIASSVAVTTRK